MRKRIVVIIVAEGCQVSRYLGESHRPHARFRQDTSGVGDESRNIEDAHVLTISLVVRFDVRCQLLTSKKQCFESGEGYRRARCSRMAHKLRYCVHYSNVCTCSEFIPSPPENSSRLWGQSDNLYGQYTREEQMRRSHYAADHDSELMTV